ncbi:tRNA (adenosine(37)-N6)-dimethylallyltransferase MiaA [Streptococcus sobrinus]|uniref:tRNA (adenosine(37)-N6)-dimethylallyltransferase MiaA n=1 Tax=Streptococcus sobrinus TaxID=1310 RepID=UPI000D7064AA|nr:tRNA (adenosine(37)-N6)-dimethylallyltransferase MiaA [Streptococcus sobrinus]AWN61202.1 tRNA (adenosine(37)-N6)-dimethylallyltransferase MiaA [Streptococcus sobrinus]AWN63075.1 tRNA (adenosine(37)-N6)-dimethylallyltransferase MiaA [Streptococcus sobrinus]SQG19239.1 tRNA delta(2)-isopentenylpyrophosphate transferase [Streptococcus sobrinus]
MKTKVIVVAGPTAVGKTALGIKLAQKFDGEIISGDSQQVYRKLDIGTAKASPAEQAAAHHHLIDVREVCQTYSVYDFVQEAKVTIADIVSRGKLPIIVGGTGLYLQSLLEGYHLGGQVDQEAVLAYRKELEALSDADLQARAQDLTQEFDQPNRRRIIRALELAKFGKNLINQESDYQPLLIGLNDGRSRLYDRINKRVDRMLNQDLLEEARWLYEHYPESQAARAIGYKELFPYFRGEEDLKTVSEKLKQNTRRFAKRQLTWFRNRMAIDFYEVSEPDFEQTIERAVEEFLKED